MQTIKDITMMLDHQLTFERKTCRELDKIKTFIQRRDDENYKRSHDNRRNKRHVEENRQLSF